MSTPLQLTANSVCAKIGQVISNTPIRKDAMGGCGAGQDFHVDDHMSCGSPLPKPPRAQAMLAERSSAGANEKTAKPEPCERALVPPTPHPPAPQGSDEPPVIAPQVGDRSVSPCQAQLLRRPSDPGCASPAIFKEPGSGPKAVQEGAMEDCGVGEGYQDRSMF